MDELWTRLAEGASRVEMLLLLGLVALWWSYKRLVDDLRAAVRRRERKSKDDSDD